MSTGVLAMAQVFKRKPSVSMLVTGLEARFYKKAAGKTFFECRDGRQIQGAVERAVATALPQRVKTHSVGKNKNGETVAEFWIEWSFKASPQPLSI